MSTVEISKLVIRDFKIGYLNHCAEAGHNPDNKDLIETNIKWHEDILKLIDNAPTVKAQPKTGKWNIYYDDDAPQDGIWLCSVCGYARLVDDISPQRFCPNCGARMKEGEEPCD